jgi:2-keto-4-pentenoate hydratase
VLGWFSGGAPRAWKAGGRDQLTAAPLPRVQTSGSEWSARGHSMLVVEAEVSVRLSQTPDPDGDVAACIGSMCASIEIVGTRMVDGLKAPPAWKLADQQLHAGSVMGEEIAFVARDWQRQRGAIAINGLTREFQGTHPNGNPAFPITWLARHAASRGCPLRAGDVVMTGSWIVVEAKPGDSVDVHFEDIGTASLRITA